MQLVVSFHFVLLLLIINWYLWLYTPIWSGFIPRTEEMLFINSKYLIHGCGCQNTVFSITAWTFLMETYPEVLELSASTSSTSSQPSFSVHSQWGYAGSRRLLSQCSSNLLFPRGTKLLTCLSATNDLSAKASFFTLGSHQPYAFLWSPPHFSSFLYICMNSSFCFSDSLLKFSLSDPSMDTTSVCYRTLKFLIWGFIPLWNTAVPLKSTY